MIYLVRWTSITSLDLKRSPAMIGAALIAIASLVMVWYGLPEKVVLWQEINDQLAFALPVYMSAIAAMFTALAAIRPTTRAMDDLLDSSPYPVVSRDAIQFSVATLWCLVGYFVVVLCFYALGWWKATWGGPDVVRLALSLATIAVGGGIGWAIGVQWRHRIAPLVAMIVVVGINLAAEIVRSSMESSSRTSYPQPYHWQPPDWLNLIPLHANDAYFDDAFRLTVAGWLLAITVLCWALPALRRERTRQTMAISTLAAIVALGSASQVVWGEHQLRQTDWPPLSAYVCTGRLDGHITICVRPEFAPMLDEVADDIESIMAPLREVVAAPNQFSTAHPDYGETSEVVEIYVSPYDSAEHADHVSAVYANLFGNEPRPFGQNAVQLIIREWLVETNGSKNHDSGMPRDFAVRLAFETEAAKTEGIPPERMYNTDRRWGTEEGLAQYERDYAAALDRFLAMPDAERVVWLNANWDAIANGDLLLEDMP